MVIGLLTCTELAGFGFSLGFLVTAGSSPNVIDICIGAKVAEGFLRCALGRCTSSTEWANCVSSGAASSTFSEDENSFTLLFTTLLASSSFSTIRPLLPLPLPLPLTLYAPTEPWASIESVDTSWTLGVALPGMAAGSITIAEPSPAERKPSNGIAAGLL